ncbi:MAG: ribonuclease P protein component [Granulosicoccus sp.]
MKQLENSRRPGGSVESQSVGATRKFPRSARLLSAGDYAAAFRKNKRLSDRYWMVLVHQSEQSSPRLGLAIAKKRARLAVDRNRIKRIAREAFRHEAPNLSHKSIVIMNRDDTAKADSAILRSALDSLLARLV